MLKKLKIITIVPILAIVISGATLAMKPVLAAIGTPCLTNKECGANEFCTDIGFCNVNTSDSAKDKLTNPLPTSDVPKLIGMIVKYLMGILGSIALVMFLYGGFLWLTAAGAEARVTKGRETLIWAALGLVLIFASYSLVSFIFGALTAPK